MTQNYSALTGISAPTNLRPHTNKDYTNDVVYKHGLPRPMKWNYRLGKLNTVAMDATTPDTYQVTNNNRYVRSSKTVPLIALMMDRPGHSINTEISCNINDTKLGFDENLTTTDCCKAAHALRLVRGPSTVLNKTDQKYYPTQQQYLRSRGMTLKQQSFHYANANTGGCDPNLNNKTDAVVNVFNPSNAQFSQDGGVSSSSRTTRLTLNTIKTAIGTGPNKPIHKTFDTCRTGLPASMRASQRCR